MKHLARYLLATGLVLGAFACLSVRSASAASLADAEYEITPFGGTTVLLLNAQLSLLAPLIVDQAYPVIAKPEGKQQSVTVSSGYSLDELLNAAGIAPGSFQYAEVQLGGTDATLLTAAQATSPSTTPDFPVFFEQGAELAFADANPASYLSPGGGGGGGGADPYVNLYPGPRLWVKLKATPSAPTAGQRVRLTATVTGQAPGETLSYRWDNGTGFQYGGGYPLVQPFEIPGTYYVYAVVTGSKGSIGISPYIAIHVAKARNPKPKPKRKGHR